MVDVEEKVEYKVEKKSGAEHDIANAADKGWCKSNGEEGNIPRQDLGTEYNVQKEKEKLD